MRETARVVLVAGALAAVACLLWRWPPAGDDAYHHTVLGVEQARAWAHGAWWPRFHEDWNGGTGSFVPAVYSPLVLSLDGALTAMTREGSQALGLSLVLALLAGWLVLRRVDVAHERRGAWVWLLAPYPVVTVMARASATEVWALAAAAGVLLLGLPPGPRGNRQGVALALLTAVVAGCQVSMVIQIAWLLAAGWVAAGLRSRVGSAMRAAAWVGTGLLVGGVLWWPLVADLRFFNHEKLVGGPFYDWREHFVVSLSGNRELGPVLLATALALAAVLLVWAWSPAPRTPRSRALAGACCTALVLTTPLAVPLWHLPGMAGLQFPWRFLGPATIAGVALLGHMEGTRRVFGLGILLLPVLLCPVQMAAPEPALGPQMSGAELARRAAVRYGIAPILPSSPGMASRGFDAGTSLGALARQGAVLRRLGGGGEAWELAVDGSGGETLLPLQWWPSWLIRSDGAATSFRNRHGLVSVTLEPGSHLIQGRLRGSPARRGGMLVSLLGLVLLRKLVVIERRRRRSGARGHGRTSADDSPADEGAQGLLP